MSYTLTYLVNGKRKALTISDWDAENIKRSLKEHGDQIDIGYDTVPKKHVQLEKDSEHQLKKGDLRADLNRAANACKICNRYGFILKADGCMHPCKCQIEVKQNHGKDGYDFPLLADENVKSDVKLLEPEKKNAPILDEDQMRAGMIKAIKSAIKANPEIKPGHFFYSIIERYGIAPEEAGQPTEAW